MTDDFELKQKIVAAIPRLRRFARGLTGSAADADDLVQTALEKALKKLHQFEVGTRLDSWLFRIVQTSFLDERRKASRREEGVDMDVLERLPAHTGDQGEAGLVRRDIERALATLSDDQRVLVVLVLVEGYSYQEASDVLNVPVGTIMSRLSRSRKALMRALEEGQHD